MRFSDIPRGSAQRTGMRPFAAGLIAVLVVGLGTFFAFTKANPFASPYELQAVFANANRVAERSPVRIAGVNVGEVKSVEPLEDGSGYARVTMEIDDAGLPIHKDAQLKVRSRLFLEGNYFVELRPGTPDKPELASGATLPPQQTAAPVQFNQVLTALQSETREDLRTLLKEYSSALKGPGARGFNEAIRHWEDAYRDGSQVADATRGQEAHDLSRLLRGQGRVFGALSRNPQQLSELVTDLNDTIAGLRAPGGQPARHRARAARRAARGPPGADLAELGAAVGTPVRARRAAGGALVERDAGRPAPVHPPGAGADLRARAARPGPQAPGHAAAADPPEHAHPGHARAVPRAGLVPEPGAAAVRQGADPGPVVPVGGQAAVLQGVLARAGGAVRREPPGRRQLALLPGAGRRRRHHAGADRRERPEAVLQRAAAAGRRPPGQAAQAARVPARRAVRDPGPARPELHHRRGRDHREPGQRAPVGQAARQARRRAGGAARVHARLARGAEGRGPAGGPVGDRPGREEEGGCGSEAGAAHPPARHGRAGRHGGPGPGRGRLHPVQPAAALPAAGGEAGADVGRAAQRPGRDARPGPDRPRVGHAHRGHRQGRAPGRARPRAHGRRARVRRHGPPRRHRAAAPAHRPQGHVPGAGPRHPPRARAGARRGHPDRQLGARPERRRDPGRAGHRHPRLPEAADQRRGQGPEGARPATCARSSAGSGRCTATSRRCRARWSSAAATWPGWCTTTAPRSTGWGARTSDLATLVSGANRVFGRLSREDGNISEAVSRLPGTLAQTEATLRRVRVLGREAGPAFEALRPAVRQIDAGQPPAAPAGRDRRAGAAQAGAPVRARGAAVRGPGAPGRHQPGQGLAATCASRSSSSTASSTWPPTTPAGASG